MYDRRRHEAKRRCKNRSQSAIADCLRIRRASGFERWVVIAHLSLRFCKASRKCHGRAECYHNHSEPSQVDPAPSHKQGFVGEPAFSQKARLADSLGLIDHASSPCLPNDDPVVILNNL